jgi:cytochrome c-type biogenesis protein CcmH
MTRAILIAIICLFASNVAFAQAGPEKLADPQAEARAVALQKEFRCLVCQGESLDESNATLAADLRRLIRARIESGDTNAQVERYLVSRYGNFILMKPPLEPDTYLLWFGPIALLGIGGAVAAAVVFRARNRLPAKPD